MSKFRYLTDTEEKKEVEAGRYTDADWNNYSLYRYVTYITNNKLGN